ncbi:MAG: hypothetical protein HC836_22805 [Richelia sp. RM2_1_2]|nr:hypothetical protein [Richelia sp. RM2_1_2]
MTIDAEASEVKDHLNCLDLKNENFCLIARHELDERLINETTYIKFYSNAKDRKGIYVIPSELLMETEYYTDNSLYGDDIILDEE